MGYRSPYLSHAKRALYHLSYIPFYVANPSMAVVINKFTYHGGGYIASRHHGQGCIAPPILLLRRQENSTLPLVFAPKSSFPGKLSFNQDFSRGVVIVSGARLGCFWVPSYSSFSSLDPLLCPQIV